MLTFLSLPMNMLVCGLFRGVLYLVFIFIDTQVHVKLLQWIWVEMAVGELEELLLLVFVFWATVGACEESVIPDAELVQGLLHVLQPFELPTPLPPFTYTCWLKTLKGWLLFIVNSFLYPFFYLFYLHSAFF